MSVAGLGEHVNSLPLLDALYGLKRKPLGEIMKVLEAGNWP